MQLSQDTIRLLNAFAMRTRRSFYGIRQGSHRSQRRGHGVEFSDFRNYELGDNPRYIDWNLFARSDKLLVKRYLEEENVALYIVIDGSRSMTHPSLQEKWDLACHIAAFASYIGLASQDPVTISILGGPHSPRFWSGRSFGPLTSFLREATETLVSPDAQELRLPEEARRAATRVSFPGICLVISDFLCPLEDVAATLAAFRARNMEVHAVQVLGESDLSLESEQDQYTFTVGVWRAVKLLDKHGIKASIFPSSGMVDKYPDLFRELVSKGHEIVGRSSDQGVPPTHLTPENERLDIVKATQMIEQVVGRRPVGWISPEIGRAHV